MFTCVYFMTSKREFEKVIAFRVDNKIHAELEQRAKLVGLKLSTYIRTLIIKSITKKKEV